MTEPRHILLTTDVVGGVWDFCLTLARGLRAAGDQVTLLAIGSPTVDQRRAAERAGCHLVHAALKLEWMEDASTDVETTRALVADLAREMRADIVHANQFVAACAPVHVPVVLTVHSDVLSWRRWTLGSSDTPPEWLPYMALVREALLRADAVVAVSRFLADQVQSIYGIDRPVDVVHNGWPKPESRPGGQRQPITLLAGRVWDNAKNVRLVADAARGWNPGPVYLAGETAHPDGGRAEVPPPLQPLGFVPRAELDAWFNRALVYISPACYDPFGLLPLQAALHGCRLLLSDIPSYREVWGDTARFFRSNDADDLRRQWECLLVSPPDFAAHDLARTRYTAQHMIDAYRDVYVGTRSEAAA
jgi:glycogen synthase